MVSECLCEVFPLCKGHLSIFLMHLQFYLLGAVAKSVQQKGIQILALGHD